MTASTVKKATTVYEKEIGGGNMLPNPLEYSVLNVPLFKRLLFRILIIHRLQILPTTK